MLTIVGHYSEAQTSVAGRVIDSISGEPMAGATLTVVGTRQRVSTDENGNFLLNDVPDNATIRASFIGYRSEEHTSELQSLMRISYAVFCLKKNKKKINTHTSKHY